VASNDSYVALSQHLLNFVVLFYTVLRKMIAYTFVNVSAVAKAFKVHFCSYRPISHIS